MDIHFLAPGDPAERTGGHIYNQRLLAELQAHHGQVRYQSLPGDYPEPDDAARTAARDVLAGIADDAIVVIDGLALGGIPDEVEAEAERLRIVGLVHLPLAAEFGLARELLEARGRAEQRALMACRRIIANSEFTRDQLRARGFGANSIDVVVPGTDPAPLAAGTAPAAPLHLLCVAALTPRKGQDLLVDALCGLIDLDWRCELVGSLERDPAFAADVRQRVEAAGLGDRITFAGELAGAELEAAWARADLAVLASRYEGFGMVLTEAVARGLPVVATAGGAVAEALPTGTGVLAAPSDVTALRAALFEVMADPERRAALVAGAQAARPALPDWPTQAERFHAALERTGG